MLMRFSVSNFMSFGSKEDDIGKIIPTEYHLVQSSIKIELFPIKNEKY